MSEYTLSFKPAIGLYGQHDPSAALFAEEELIFGVEEERFTRQKHAINTFPEQAIRACLAKRNLRLPDLDRIVLPYNPQLRRKILSHYVQDALSLPTAISKVGALEQTLISQTKAKFRPTNEIETRLAEIGEPVPPIVTASHHKCHAVSAFHPSGFERGLVLTVDAKGEYDSTVVWYGDKDGLQRLRTYEHPNSLGLFFAIITEYLGYRMFNGEGKIMGLAPYGQENPQIEKILRRLIDTGFDYDVTELTRRWGTGYGIRRLETAFDRLQRDEPGEFTQWEKDLAYTAQKLLEETVLGIIETYAKQSGVQNVALAGGVALNCKMNSRIRESDTVDSVFVQPVANDAGLALGGGWVEQCPADVASLETVYFGPQYTNDEIERMLETNKIEYRRLDNITEYVAERLADGALVGWFQGQQEMGPRALGNRSILADPRTTESRDRVNKFVKHREEWRPFAPSMLAEAAEEYLVDAAESPFMIDAFTVDPDHKDDVAAVLHPADDTTRPQTVQREQNPRYYDLITAFERHTGVPVLLNTSFNDHAEPIVTTPAEALKDFYGMGLDVLVLEDFIIEKKLIEKTKSVSDVEPVPTR